MNDLTSMDVYVKIKDEKHLKELYKNCKSIDEHCELDYDFEKNDIFVYCFEFEAFSRSKIDSEYLIEVTTEQFIEILKREKNE